MELSVNQVFSRVFLWLCLGLCITFCSGYALQFNLDVTEKIFTGYTYMILVIVEIALALILSTRIHKMKPSTCKLLYVIYTALTGLTFSGIFITYQISSIIYIFGVTAILLLIFGYLGYKTNLDLTKFGTFLFIGLIGIFILIIVSFFVESVALNLGLCILSLVIFLGYMVYDMNAIKRNIAYAENLDNIAIYGAFQLYLDFINVFLRLLELFGRRD
jgi:hypothetical protein